MRELDAVVLKTLSVATGQYTDEIARMTFNPSASSTSSNNLLAYHPNFTDFHTSGLAANICEHSGYFPLS